MLKLNIYNVYLSKKLISSLKIQDIDKVFFIKEGVNLQYFFSFYNVLFALRRGFKLFGLLLLVSQIMFSYIISSMPFGYWVFCNFCFNFFVLNIASDIEEFFIKRSKYILITQVVAKNLSEAQEKFFVEFYPEYLVYLEKNKRRLMFGNNFYFNINERDINNLRKKSLLKTIKAKYSKIVESIKNIKNIKIGVFKN